MAEEKVETGSSARAVRSQVAVVGRQRSLDAQAEEAATAVAVVAVAAVRAEFRSAS
jgi:hypothetical protein